MEALPTKKEYEVIQEMAKGKYSISLLCEIAEVSKSGYYKWLKRKAYPSRNQLEDQKIKELNFRRQKYRINP